MGLGDRFSHQGDAQLSAVIKAGAVYGIEITPVWNKSNREHNIVHSEPADTRAEADAAVNKLKFQRPVFCRCRPYQLKYRRRFIHHSDFFTLDVADYIGKKAADTDIAGFVENHRHYCGTLRSPASVRHSQSPKTVSGISLRNFCSPSIRHPQFTGTLHRSKGEGNFVTEVSMDEVDEPQKPLDMLFILKGLADLKVPVQTIAPKFTGRFNKGSIMKETHTVRKRIRGRHTCHRLCR